MDIHVGDEIPPVRTWVVDKSLPDANGNLGLRARRAWSGSAETVKHTTAPALPSPQSGPEWLSSCSRKANHEGPEGNAIMNLLAEFQLVPRGSVLKRPEPAFADRHDLGVFRARLSRRYTFYGTIRNVMAYPRRGTRIERPVISTAFRPLDTFILRSI